MNEGIVKFLSDSGPQGSDIRLEMIDAVGIETTVSSSQRSRLKIRLSQDVKM